MSGNLKRLIFTNTLANYVLIGTWMVVAVFLTRIIYLGHTFGLDDLYGLMLAEAVGSPEAP